MRKWSFLGILSIVIILFACDNEDEKQQGDQVADQIENLDSLLVAHPDSVPLLLKRANKLFDTYDYDLAMNDAAKAFRLDSANVQAQLIYAEVMNNRETRTVAEVAAAQRLYSDILRKEPENVRALVGLASTFSYQQDFEKSFQYINNALRIDKFYRNAYVLKGSNYMKMGKMDLAKSSYQTAIQQDPEFFEAYFWLGQIYQSEADPICIEYFQTALDLRPEIQEVRYQLAYSKQLIANDYEGARVLYRVMAQDTSDFYISHALFQQGHMHQFGAPVNLDSAVYYYKSTLKTDPRHWQSWYNMGICYAEQGDRTRALKAMGKTLKYNPEFEEARRYADSIR